MELCRPVAGHVGVPLADAATDIQVRNEPAHDEAFIRFALTDMGWPAMLPAYDALEAWVKARHRQAAGAPRQVLIADQRTAAPEAPVCDLAIPLK